MISGLEFETWSAKVVRYLESNFIGSALTAKAVEIYKRLNVQNHQNYLSLLGIIKAAKEMEEEEAKNAAEILDLN